MRTFPRPALWLGLVATVAAVIGSSNAAAFANSYAHSALIAEPGTTTALDQGGSATQFSVDLPTNAACPGDTAHKYFLVNSYVEPISVNPDTVSFRGGVQHAGASLISTIGDPFEGRNTDENTGQVPQIPIFSWAPYAHQQQVLPLGTYNVGIICANQFGVGETYWNAVIQFSASSSDSGGFTWRVLSKTTRTGGGSFGTFAGIVVALIVVLAVGVVVFVRPRRRTKLPG